MTAVNQQERFQNNILENPQRLYARISKIQSELYGDVERSAEMTDPLLLKK